MKDIDTETISDLLRAYFYCMLTLALPSVVLAGLIGLLIASVACIPLAFLIYGITDKIGNRWSRLFYAGRKPVWTIQEKFQSDLDQVTYFKRQKQFPQGLEKVNEILKQKPEFAEALFLKAQILWEGYQSANGARRYLNMAKDFASPDESLYRWISSYQDSINKG